MSYIYDLYLYWYVLYLFKFFYKILLNYDSYPNLSRWFALRPACPSCEANSLANLRWIPMLWASTALPKPRHCQPGPRGRCRWTLTTRLQQSRRESHPGRAGKIPEIQSRLLNPLHLRDFSVDAIYLSRSRLIMHENLLSRQPCRAEEKNEKEKRERSVGNRLRAVQDARISNFR